MIWGICGGVCGVLLIWLFVWFNNSCLKLTRRKIKIDGAPKLKIVHLSDLHSKRFGRRNSRLVKKVMKEKPDFIAVTGDIIHLYTPKNREVALEAVSSLKEVAPLLYIAGNHEMRNKGYRLFRKEVAEAGGTVLDDRAVEICGITVVGLNGASLRNDKIEKITPPVSPKILLAHEPQFFEKYAAAGYDLILCGHAHGGQWRIPFTKIGLFAPGQGKFPKYTAGVHEKGKSKMIISRGLGNSEFPLRLFNRPEIISIEIN